MGWDQSVRCPLESGYRLGRRGSSTPAMFTSNDAYYRFTANDRQQPFCACCSMVVSVVLANAAFALAEELSEGVGLKAGTVPADSGLVPTPPLQWIVDIWLGGPAAARTSRGQRRPAGTCWLSMVRRRSMVRYGAHR